MRRARACFAARGLTPFPGRPARLSRVAISQQDFYQRLEEERKDEESHIPKSRTQSSRDFTAATHTGSATRTVMPLISSISKVFHLEILGMEEKVESSFTDLCGEREK